MSSPPGPRSTATATTSRPVSLPIQLIATEVSRPPEYARMTRSDMNQSPIRSSLFEAFPGAGQLGAGHGADRVRERPAIGWPGQKVSAAGRGSQPRQIGAGVGRDQQLTQQPGKT